MKNKCILIVLLIGFLLANSTLSSGIPPGKSLEEFHLATLFQSKMVIQQGKDLKIWGKTRPKSKVSVKTDWDTRNYQSESKQNGSWQISIPVPKIKAGDYRKHSLTIIHNGGELVLDEILIGEVWVCSGQSNMDMEMKANLPWLEGVVDFEKEIAGADYPNIRFIKVEKNFTKNPKTDTKGNWDTVSPSSAGEISGLAYYFAKDLQEKLNVPIGLVISSFGGSAAQAWVSREALAEDEILMKNYLEPYENSSKSKESLENIETLEQLFDVLTRPSLLYNAMIHPLKNLSIRGFLWYQGEANKNESHYYTQLSKVLIESWRKDFDQANAPFYFVQMTPYNWEENDPTEDYYAKFREAQEKVLVCLPNVGMAVTMDIGEMNNIHPRNKKDVGLRLSRIALNLTYGIKEIQYMGPKFKDLKIEGSQVKVMFDSNSLGSGLSTNDGEAPKHFYISGEDGILYPAIAKLLDDMVILHAKEVENPVAVRYAFTNYPITNFQNKEGLPAFPFRTDKHPHPL